jgi:hypothetical protein
MKIIINTINIYHIHDNSYNTCGNHFKANKDKMDDADLSEFSPAIIVNGNFKVLPIVRTKMLGFN